MLKFKRITLGNVQVDHADMIRQLGELNSTPVRPAVVWVKFIHPDDEEGPGGVVVYREAPFFLPLVVFVDL